MKIYTCHDCGTQFERNTGGKHKFCDNCKQLKAKFKANQYECRHCGEPFEGQKPAEQGGRTYCSADCKTVAEETRSCERCHKQYIPKVEYRGYRGIAGAAVCRDCKEQIKDEDAEALFIVCQSRARNLAKRLERDAIKWSLEDELNFIANDIRNDTRAFTVSLGLYSYKAVHAAKAERTGDHINGMTNIVAMLINHVLNERITTWQQTRKFLDDKTPTIQVCKDENSTDLKAIQMGHIAFSPETYYDACGGIYFFDHNDEPTLVTKQEFVELCGHHFLTE